MAERALPAPVRRLADMSPEEQRRLRETLKPPPKVAPVITGFACTRASSKQADERNESVEVVAVRELTQTPKAVGFVLPDRVAPLWVPHRYVRERDDMDDGTVSFKVPRWLAENEGLV